MVVHSINPVYDEKSEILILGSFPSVKSREDGFFYAHKQNRFWRVLSKAFDTKVPETVEEKKKLLLLNHIALWDVIHSCDINGSADSSIKNVVANDLSVILDNAEIKTIITNGKTADKLYNKYIYPDVKIKSICLASTSPANARVSLDDLSDIWKEYLIKQCK